MALKNLGGPASNLIFSPRHGHTWTFFIRDVKVSFNNAPPEYYQQWQQRIKWRYYFGRSFVWPCH
jgi:hypothetical protein